MKPGGFIAVGAVVLFVGWLGYEIWLRNWLESRHCIRLLSEMAEKERRADELVALRRIGEKAEEMREEIEVWDALARQLEQIRNLPEYNRLGSWAVDE